MGPSVSKSTSESVQRTMFEQSQVINNGCRTITAQGINNVSQNFKGVRIEGNVEFAQTADVDINCVFDNNITSIAELVQQAYAENTASADKQRGLVGLLNVLSIEITESTTIQDIEAQIRQQMENICLTTIDQSINNIEQTWIEVEVGGDLLFTQDADASGSCIAYNLGKIQTQLELELEQKNNSGGSRNWLFYLLIAGIIFIVFISIISLIFGREGKKKDECTETPDVCKGETGDVLLACLNAITPPEFPFCALQNQDLSNS